MKNFLKAILLIGVLSPLTLMAGPWPKPVGGAYLKLSQWWVIADQHYTDQGLIDPNVTSGIFNTSLYAEYGLTDRLTATLYFPFYSRAYFNNIISGTTGETITPGEAINSIGDTDISLTYGLSTGGPTVLSATFLIGLPLGNDRGGSQGNLQTGDGEFNQMIRLDLGQSFKIGPHNAYASLYGGFNNRTNGFSDELRFGVEAGVTIFDNKLTAIGRLFGIQSLQNGSAGSDLTGTSIFANNSEHITFSPEIAYHLNEHWGVSASLGAALSGQLIFANTSYSFGVFLNI